MNHTTDDAPSLSDVNAQLEKLEARLNCGTELLLFVVGELFAGRYENRKSSCSAISLRFNNIGEKDPVRGKCYNNDRRQAKAVRDALKNYYREWKAGVFEINSDRGTPQNRVVEIELSAGHGWKPIIGWLSRSSETGPSGQVVSTGLAPAATPSSSDPASSTHTRDLSFLLGKSFHHYHLTLNKDGGREWHYTVLTFDKTQQRVDSPVAYVKQRSHDPHFDHRWYAYHPFKSGSHLLGFKVSLLGQSEIMPQDLNANAADNDVGWEFFNWDGSDIDFGAGLQGVRVNKPYAKDNIASSITLITRHPLADLGLASGVSAVVPALRGPLLLRQWNDLNRSDNGYGGFFVFPASMGMAVGASTEESRVLGFWKDYLISTVDRRQTRCLIFYGEPYFQRDAQHTTFVRVVGHEDREKWIAIPDSHADRAQSEHRRANISKALSDVGVVFDSHSFLNAGEVKAMLHLKRWFAQRGVDIDERSRTHVSELKDDDKEVNGSNGIVLGIPEVNGLIVQYQEKYSRLNLPFTCHPDGIYKDHRPFVPLLQPEGSLTNIAHALVTKLPGQQEGGEKTVVTLIVSDIGRAIQGAAKALTLPNVLEKLCQNLRGEYQEVWPECFQLVIKVHLDRDGYPKNKAEDYELVDSWPPMERFFSGSDGEHR